MKTKAEAAEYLGISVRTLERYTRAQRIPAQYEKGKRHARVVYREEDLEALKADLAAERSLRQPDVRTPNAMRRIGFRLEPVDLKRLEELARREDVSPGDYARHLVITALHDTRDTQLAATVTTIERRLGELRQDFRQQTEAAGNATAGLAQATGATERLQKDLRQITYLLLCQMTEEEPEQVAAWLDEVLGRTVPGEG